jgi:hypothetical protein
MNANDTHLTDDELVLHYYGEMPDPDERRTAAHLSACGACHASYRRLQRVLAVVDEAAAVAGPELPAHFERTVWARLEPELRRDRGHWFSWLVQSPSRLAWVAGVIVLVAAAFFAGRWSPRPDEAPAQASASPAQVRERILLIDLGEHLERSQMVLLEIVSADAETGFDVSERGRAEELVAANRLYRQTATVTGNDTIAALLDDIERVLVDVAASPEHPPAAQLAEVRRRIDSQDLLFKVRVISSEVRERQRSAFQRAAGQSSSM